MYSPLLGGFLTRDPIAQAGEPDLLYDNNWFGDRLSLMRNLYSYAGNNPTNRVDPFGLADVAGPTPTCLCSFKPKDKKKTKYCLYNFKSRTGKAKECLGFDIGDVYCATCPATRFCKKETSITIEENRIKCTIRFEREKRSCDVCPDGGKDANGMEIDTTETV